MAQCATRRGVYEHETSVQFQKTLAGVGGFSFGYAGRIDSMVLYRSFHSAVFVADIRLVDGEHGGGVYPVVLVWVI